jgi:predicted HTH domain antitoxin
MFEVTSETGPHLTPEVRSALERFQRGEISIGRLTELIGVDHWEIYPFLKRAGVVPPEPDDIDRDDIDAILARRK